MKGVIFTLKINKSKEKFFTLTPKEKELLDKITRYNLSEYAVPDTPNFYKIPKLICDSISLRLYNYANSNILIIDQDYYDQIMKIRRRFDWR